MYVMVLRLCSAALFVMLSVVLDLKCVSTSVNEPARC